MAATAAGGDGLALSEEYRRRRDELLRAERALRDRQEEVAALRRSLPPGPVVERSYALREGPRDLGETDPAQVRVVGVADLFTPGRSELVAYHMMFDPAWDDPCNMCNMWVDGLNGLVEHLEQRIDLVVVAHARIEDLRAWGRRRGWSLRLVSSYGTTFNRDFGVQVEGGRERDGISVLTRDAGGTVRLAYTGHSDMGDERWRGIDPYCATWAIYDLLPSGRGDWYPSLDYLPAR